MAGYKSNIQRVIIFEPASNKHVETEIKHTIPFIIDPKEVKHLGINQPKPVQGMYAKNYKMLVREMKKDRNKWRDRLCHGLEDSAQKRYQPPTPFPMIYVGLLQFLSTSQQGFFL